VGARNLTISAEVEVPADVGAGQIYRTLGGESAAAVHVSIDGQPACGEGVPLGVGQGGLEHVEVAMNVGTEQADHALDGHLPAAFQVLANLDSLGLQRDVARVGEGGVGEAKLAADPRPHQVDLSVGGEARAAPHVPLNRQVRGEQGVSTRVGQVGARDIIVTAEGEVAAEVGARQVHTPSGEPVIQFHVATRLQLCSVEDGNVAAGHAYRGRFCLGKVDLLLKGAVEQEQRTNQCCRFQVKDTDDPGAGQTQRPWAARAARGGEQVGQQRRRHDPPRFPLAPTGGVILLGLPGS
jgi:hypothetical protein